MRMWKSELKKKIKAIRNSYSEKISKIQDTADKKMNNSQEMLPITIYVKSVSSRLNKTEQVSFLFPNETMSFKQFLKEIAKLTVKEFNAGKPVEAIFKCLTYPLQNGKANEKDLFDIMLSCLESKKFVVLIDGKKCEDLDKQIHLSSDSVIEFSRQMYTGV